MSDRAFTCLRSMGFLNHFGKVMKTQNLSGLINNLGVKEYAEVALKMPAIAVRMLYYQWQDVENDLKKLQEKSRILQEAYAKVKTGREHQTLKELFPEELEAQKILAEWSEKVNRESDKVNGEQKNTIGNLILEQKDKKVNGGENAVPE